MEQRDVDLPPQPWKLQPSEEDLDSIKRDRPRSVEDIDGPEGLGYSAQEAEHRGPVPRWAPDDQAPDYAHLLAGEGDPSLPKLQPRVTVTAAALELLIKANAFQPEGFGGKIAIALRGAKLVDRGQYEEVQEFPIEDVRPDHRTFRCTIGFYDRITGLLWAYRGSTVPNPIYMAKQVSGAANANLLPTGCYVFRKGTHGYSHKVPITPALRITNPGKLTDDGPATVLRSKDDLTFTWDDTWDDNDGESPNNNVHCAYSDSEFSSAGCLTICGSNGTLQWGRFQRILKSMPNGARVDVLLLTGRDVALAAALLAKTDRSDGEVLGLIGRLRTGSTGPAVARLQEKLGQKVTGYFGYALKKRLVDEQAKRELRSDGVYGAKLDAALGWDVMSAKEAVAPAPPSPPPGVAPKPAAPEVADGSVTQQPVPVAGPGPVVAPEPAAAAEPAPGPAPVEAPSAAPADVVAGGNPPGIAEKTGV